MDAAVDIAMNVLGLPRSFYGKVDLNENCPTYTSVKQAGTEKECGTFLGSKPAHGYNGLFEERDVAKPKLIRSKHLAYLFRGMHRLPQQFSRLDSSRPWLAYWIFNSTDLLGHAVPPETRRYLIDFLGQRCYSTQGGFCGGPDQLAHLAPTYASTLAICSLGTEDSYKSIRRGLLYRYLLSLKSTCGGFAMHADGEVDVRAVYIAVCIADLTGMLTEQLAAGAVEFIASCYSHEGGFAGEPGCEPHGGYNFCAVAALKILNAWNDPRIDARAHARWLATKQMLAEGGFQGRSHKLVDGCYSFWYGGAFGVSEEAPVRTAVAAMRRAGAGVSGALARRLRARRAAASCSEHGDPVAAPVASSLGFTADVQESQRSHGARYGVRLDDGSLPRTFCDAADSCKYPTISAVSSDKHTLVYRASAPSSGEPTGSIEHLLQRGDLQRYLLRCCQQPDGGLRDKPSMRRDYYHTMYCLLGLASSYWKTGLLSTGARDAKPSFVGVLGDGDTTQHGEYEKGEAPVPSDVPADDSDLLEAALAKAAAGRSSTGTLERSQPDPSSSRGNKLPAPDQKYGIRWDRATAARSWFRREGSGPRDHEGLLRLAQQEKAAAEAETVLEFLKIGGPMLPAGDGGDAGPWWQQQKGGLGGEPGRVDRSDFARDRTGGRDVAGLATDDDGDSSGEDYEKPGGMLFVPEADEVD